VGDKGHFINKDYENYKWRYKYFLSKKFDDYRNRIHFFDKTDKLSKVSEIEIFKVSINYQTKLPEEIFMLEKEYYYINKNI